MVFNILSDSIHDHSFSCCKSKYKVCICILGNFFIDVGRLTTTYPCSTVVFFPCQTIPQPLLRGQAPQILWYFIVLYWAQSSSASFFSHTGASKVDAVSTLQFNKSQVKRTTWSDFLVMLLLIYIPGCCWLSSVAEQTLCSCVATVIQDL